MLAAKKRRSRSQFSSLSGDERQMLRDKAVQKMRASDTEQAGQQKAQVVENAARATQPQRARARMPKFGKVAPAPSGDGGLGDAIKRVADQRAKMPAKGAPTAPGGVMRRLMKQRPKRSRRSG